MRNPSTGTDPASKPQGTSGGNNSKGIPPYGRNDNGGDMTVLVINVFGQQVAELPVKSEKTVWDTRNEKKGIYFFNVEVDEKVLILSGKIVVQ